jgi:DNA-binding MarR family transcriptional regulator
VATAAERTQVKGPVLRRSAGVTPADPARRALRSYLRAVALAEPMQGELARRHGLTLSDWFALRRLGELGAAPMNRLASACGASPSSTTELVDRLTEAGLVARAGHPTDRRVTLVQLTDAGEQALADVEVFRHSPVMDGIRRLEATEQVLLAGLLERIHESARRTLRTEEGE